MLLEPYNVHPNADPEAVRTEALLSIAVSLKRIADMMASEYPPREAEPHRPNQAVSE